MRNERERVHGRLLEEGGKVAEYFEGLPGSAWVQQVYTTGSRWRVREVLAHLVAAEQSYIRFIGDVLQGGPGYPRGFDLDAFNEAEVASRAASSPAELLGVFRDARAETARLVLSLPDEDLSRRGYHPWFGDSVLRDMLKLIYRHNMIHLRDVRRALQRRLPVPHLEVTPPASREDPAA